MHISIHGHDDWCYETLSSFCYCVFQSWNKIVTFMRKPTVIKGVDCHVHKYRYIEHTHKKQTLAIKTQCHIGECLLHAK